MSDRGVGGIDWRELIVEGLSVVGVVVLRWKIVIRVVVRAMKGGGNLRKNQLKF